MIEINGFKKKVLQMPKSRQFLPHPFSQRCMNSFKILELYTNRRLGGENIVISVSQWIRCEKDRAGAEGREEHEELGSEDGAGWRRRRVGVEAQSTGVAAGGKIPRLRAPRPRPAQRRAQRLVQDHHRRPGHRVRLLEGCPGGGRGPGQGMTVLLPGYSTVRYGESFWGH